MMELTTFLAHVLIIHLSGIALVNSSRIKRDDGSYASDTGGPVASESEGEARGGTIDPVIQEALSKLDPCEAKLSPLFNKSSIGSLKNSLLQGKELPIGALNNKQSLTTPNTLNRTNIKEDIEEKFKKFLAQFNKTYPTTEHLDKARNFFKDNFDKLLKMHGERRSPFDASFVMGKFSDMDFGTFANLHTGALLPLDKPLIVDSSLLVNRSCPQLNWTSLEVISPVRKQDKCGCCYAMSTADMVAAQYSIDTKNYTKHYLSSQWISDCMPAPSGYQCNGGRPLKVLETLANKTLWRIPTDKCYPFTDGNGTCRYSKNCTDTPPIEVKSGTMVNIAGPIEKELMAALLQHGPVVAIVGISQAWQMYNGTGVIRPYQCTNDQNHAVLITGYDYSGCVPTYIIKNSWGADWGGRGYVKLEAGKNTCHVAESVVATCTSKDCDKTNLIKHILSTSNHPSCK